LGRLTNKQRTKKKLRFNMRRSFRKKKRRWSSKALYLKNLLANGNTTKGNKIRDVLKSRSKLVKNSKRDKNLLVSQRMMSSKRRNLLMRKRRSD